MAKPIVTPGWAAAGFDKGPQSRAPAANRMYITAPIDKLLITLSVMFNPKKPGFNDYPEESPSISNWRISAMRYSDPQTTIG